MRTDDEMQPESAICDECSKEFTFTPFRIFGPEVIRDTTCETCCEARNARAQKSREEAAAAQTQKDRKEFWEEICPERFLESDINHPEFRRQLYSKVMGWTPDISKPWLGIVGKKGCCKTRIGLMRLRQAVMTKEGPFKRGSTSPVFITAHEFADTVQSRFGTGHDKANEKLEEISSARWLMFDDVGKARNTPAVVAALFALIDHRHSSNLTTIWTANSTPEEFCEGMPPDVAGPLVRRLKESSTLLSIT